MNHAATIVALLLFAWVLYLAANGKLRDYVAVFWGATAAPLPKDTSSGSGSSSDLSKATEVAKVAATVFGGG